MGATSQEGQGPPGSVEPMMVMMMMMILENVLVYFNVFHLPRVNQIQNIQTINEMYSNIFYVFYSQCSHQHVSVGIPTFFRTMLLLQEYKHTIL